MTYIKNFNIKSLEFSNEFHKQIYLNNLINILFLKKNNNKNNLFKNFIKK